MPQPIKIVGGGVVQPGVEAAIDPLFQAARFSARPIDYTNLGQNLGHYALVATTSAALWSANAILFAFRWTDPSRFSVIQSLSVGATVVTAVTAQRVDPVVATIARSYTVRDLTNATVVTMSGNNQKQSTKMGTSLIGNIDVASAAAGLTGGTKTLDANSIGFSSMPGLLGLGTAVANTVVLDPNTGDGEHPIILAANEGLVVSWGPTALATGTATVTVKVRWAEAIQF